MKEDDLMELVSPFNTMLKSFSKIVGLQKVLDKFDNKALKNTLDKDTADSSVSHYYKTIKGRNDDNIMYFPLVTSDSLSLDTIETLRNQLELERAFEFENVLSNVSQVQGKFATDEYHTNYRMGENDNMVLEDLVEESSINDMSINTFMKRKLEENKQETHNNKVIKEDEDENKKNKEGITASVTKSSEGKTNSAIPTYIQTDVTWDKGSRKTSIRFGVKTMVHIVDYNDVIHYLGQKTRGSNFLVNLVKLTTGELRLVRDLILNVEDSKKIARDSVDKKNGSIWHDMNTIYSTTVLDKISKNKSKRNFIPTATVMISIEEVHEIKRQTSIDILNNKRAAQRIYDSFYLLEFIVVDEINETVYKYHGGRNLFETHKLSRMGGMKVSNNDKSKGLTRDELRKLLLT